MHDVKLVIPRKYLSALLASFFVRFFDDLGIVLEDVGQAEFGKRFFPEIVSLQPAWIGRVARAIIKSPVEREKPRVLSIEFGAEPYLLVVHSKVDHTTAELEEQFLRIAIPHVLFYCILNSLFGEPVLKFKCCDEIGRASWWERF